MPVTTLFVEPVVSIERLLNARCIGEAVLSSRLSKHNRHISRGGGLR